MKPRLDPFYLSPHQSSNSRMLTLDPSVSLSPFMTSGPVTLSDRRQFEFSGYLWSSFRHSVISDLINLILQAIFMCCGCQVAVETAAVLYC